jgi:tRNA(fMet)-specific endonuclease VapC
VAAEFDRLRENKKLKKIGRADLLIACIALANRATLVSRNLKHFGQVPGLQAENWAD